MKPQPLFDVVGGWRAEDCTTPYARVGDRLWCKETWRPIAHETRKQNHYGLRRELIRYAADEAEEWRSVARGWRRPKAARTGNVSPLFMPRWASRITLEVASVRVERVADITDADAMAEGITAWTKDGALYKYAVSEPGDTGAERWTDMARSPREAYRRLWNTINGGNRKHEWIVTGEDTTVSSPWCWVIEFQRLP